MRRFSSAHFYIFALLVCALAAVPSAQAQTFQVTYTFTGEADGSSPWAGLTMDKAGNFYGTTVAGGAGYGVVFELLYQNHDWVLIPLYNFAYGNDGAYPKSRVMIGPGGSLLWHDDRWGRERVLVWLRHGFRSRRKQRLRAQVLSFRNRTSPVFRGE